MKIKALIIAAAVFAGLASGTASAHPYGHHGERYEHRHAPRYHDRYDRHHDFRQYRHGHRPYRLQRGAGPYHDIYLGQRLPRHYWHREHWVGNWRGHGVPRPPHNHVWVRTGNRDYMLVSLRSGIVKQVILSR